jgi:hypothetical protein
MRFVHDRIFPVLCHLSKTEDRELFIAANHLNYAGFSADQLGLPEDFQVPLTAAVRHVKIRTVPAKSALGLRIFRSELDRDINVYF